MQLLRYLRNFILDVLVILMVLAGVNYVDSHSPSMQQELSSVQNLFGAYFPSQQIVNPPSAPQEAAAVSVVSPAVVSIFGYDDTSPDLAGYTKVTAGTGFFVDPSGYILTNKHVVSDDQANYVVVLSNGRHRSATVAFKDPDNDLAIVKIGGSGYKAVLLGDSSRLKIGDAVIGMGNAFGKVNDTVSLGAISAMHRDLVAVDDRDAQPLHNLIQTTAQLYPGDSGGPLFDLSGKVVGVNVAISTGRHQASFSIPIDDAKDVIQTVVGK